MSATAFDRIRAARAVFLDWDGCLVEDGALLDGGRDFLKTFADKISIISNNSTDDAGRVAAFLLRAGVSIPAERIHLAGVAALEAAARRFQRRRVYLLANAAMTRAAVRLGVDVSAAHGHDAVVLLRDTQFSFRRLEAAVDSLARGAHLIVANGDLTHPKAGGVTPETGALLAAIGACVDLAQIPTTLVGKPSPALFERALAVSGVRPQDAIMIGDNPITDGEGAQRLGIPALLIGGARGLSLRTIMQGAPRA